MSSQLQKVVLGVVVVACLGILGWGLWNQFASSGTGSEGGFDMQVLCIECGHFTEAHAAELKTKDGARAGRTPLNGPGYLCPKCGKSTLYANPVICSGCKAPFIPGAKDIEVGRATCPKCGKVQ